jgi:phage shock protein C
MKKEIYRSKNKVIYGILAGIADHFDLNITLFRLIFLIIFIFTGIFPLGIFYIFSTFLVKER